ncbi:MAG: 4Fe-4S binding protein [Candidatus Kapabacteria bacterium]|nr:4Fe-4S binding protein [Candidatus Kapabacteria bacterium]
MTSNIERRPWLRYVLAVVMTSFYVCVYWFPSALDVLTHLLDGFSHLLRGRPADAWFLYGTIYTLAVVLFGARTLMRNGHERYHRYRTVVLVVVQCIAAYLIPAMLVRIGRGEFYFSYFWPLKPEYLFPSSLTQMMQSHDALMTFAAWWSIVLLLIATPLLTYFYGKRWYCSWVCGCGALAETVGDDLRHLSSTSQRSWTLERWTIYPILGIITIITILLWQQHVNPNPELSSIVGHTNRIYGFVIGGLFSGVIGVGFYPIFGARIWCRFGCPMAAILGILQKYASRFRIEVNTGQCISCGNCSTYCEMGIDVRSYAERGETIKRASCVGCGVCSTVCPRGVLRVTSDE